MKKQPIYILIVLALAAFGGWRILNTKPAPKGEVHDEAKHEHAEGDEHGNEGRVELNAEARKNADLKIEAAGPEKIETRLAVYGKIAVNEEAVAHVMPRFPGIVKEVRKRLGEPVKKGEVLATVESNESLRTYEVKSEIAGVVIKKDVTIGELVKDDKTIFVIADLHTVWADLSVFRQDFHLLKVGQPVEIHPGDDKEAIAEEISYISPFGAESTQTALARVVVPNPGGMLRPGLFVSATIGTGEVNAPVAVKLGAVQTIKEKPIVFVEEGDSFEAREVKLGTKDGEFIEVLSGIKAGDKYVADNSFILKAHLGKEEAEHED